MVIDYRNTSTSAATIGRSDKNVIIDSRLRQVPPLHADFAIIGAGAAGLTFARTMIEAGHKVILVESGGLDFEPESALLNAGSVIGQEYYDLEHARLRLLGGTTAIWGGRCAELQPIDFEKKDWVDHSGWPFGLEELKPWYAAARKLLEIPPADAGPDFPLPMLETRGRLEVRRWTFDRKQDRFSLWNNRQLIEHPKLTVLTHATVREIVAFRSGKAIEVLDVRTPSGTKLAVHARTYVLAAGGLENPRILLASNSVIPAGLGNDNDMVGRFFMEHPHARGGRLLGAPTWRFLTAFQKTRSNGGEYAPLLTVAPRLQREKRLLNSSLTIAARPPASGRYSFARKLFIHAKQNVDPTRFSRNLWKSYRRAGRNFKQLAGPIGPFMDCVRGRRELALVIRAEQAPNPNSRVTLDHDKLDATGMPRIRLDWQLCAQDVASCRSLVEIFRHEVAASGLGTVEPADWLLGQSSRWVTDVKISAHPLGGYHHMGTTRMADDPRAGVTDQWGRVNGLENLYVLGSSLFPTGGWANPTLTIIALTLRTADHLRNVHG